MSPRIQNLSRDYYNYMLREGSAITIYSENQALDQLKVLNLLFDYIREKNVVVSYLPTSPFETFIENFYYFSVKSLLNHCGSEKLFIQALDQIKKDCLYLHLCRSWSLKIHSFKPKEMKVYRGIRLIKNLMYRLNKIIKI